MASRFFLADSTRYAVANPPHFPPGRAALFAAHGFPSLADGIKSGLGLQTGKGGIGYGALVPAPGHEHQDACDPETDRSGDPEGMQMIGYPQEDQSPPQEKKCRLESREGRGRARKAIHGAHSPHAAVQIAFQQSPYLPCAMVSYTGRAGFWGASPRPKG